MQAFYNARFRVPGFEIQRVRSRELHGFTASRLPEFQRTESRELHKAERRAEETEGEVRAWRHAGIKHGKRKIS